MKNPHTTRNVVKAKIAAKTAIKKKKKAMMSQKINLKKAVQAIVPAVPSAAKQPSNGPTVAQQLIKMYMKKQEQEILS